ncbi:MAG: ArsR/SmtB family transcription factor [bacterium]|jgi:DNA-binding transcriptional ArsR family regulator
MLQMDAEQLLADLFKALGHPTRVKILKILRQGEICVCDMAPQLELEQSNVSQHLAVLRNQGLVTFSKDGLRVVYRLAHPGIMPLLDAAARLLARQVQAQQSVLSQFNRDEK